MTSAGRSAGPLRAFFVVGLGILLLLSTFFFAFTSLGFSGGYFIPYLAGALAGAAAGAGSMAYVARRQRPAFILVSAAAAILLVLLLVVFASEGLDDLFFLWLAIFALSIIEAVLVGSRRR